MIETFLAIADAETEARKIDDAQATLRQALREADALARGRARVGISRPPPRSD